MALQAKRREKRPSIGGQALIEGVMMRGPEKYCVAVRKESGEIATRTRRNSSIKDKVWIFRLPFIRGVVGMIESMKLGVGILNQSIELAEIEFDDESKFDRWLANTFGEKASAVILGIASVLAVILGMGLFMFLPTALVSLISRIMPLSPGLRSLLEGMVKMAVFVAYVVAVSRMPEIKRVFQYHGAEHKTVFCFEAGEPLTPENVRRHSRLHPRCGTSLITIAIIVSILVNSQISISSILLRTLAKIAVLPLSIGLSYELISLAGKYDNIITRTLSMPGMLIQKITTAEPDDSQIEVAIAAIKPVIPADFLPPEPDLPGPPDSDPGTPAHIAANSEGELPSENTADSAKTNPYTSGEPLSEGELPTDGGINSAKTGGHSLGDAPCPLETNTDISGGAPTVLDDKISAFADALDPAAPDADPSVGVSPDPEDSP